MENIDMVLSNGSIAHNYSTDGISSIRSIKSFFKENFKDRPIIMSQFSKVLCDSEIQELCTRVIDSGYRVLSIENDDILMFPLIYKYKGKEIKPLYSYFSSHVYSSLIKTILLDGDGPVEDRVTKATFILYHYWFTKKENFRDVGHNVCIDLETMISIIIDKSFSLYRNYTTTAEIVEALRIRLSNEKLVNLGVLG